MKILKSIYKNEVEVKKISVLKSLFIIIMFTLIPVIINFLLTFIMILIDENISLGFVMIIGTLILIPVEIIMIIIIGKKYTKKDRIRINEDKLKINKNDFLYVFLIIIGYILIREAILFDVLSQFEGPISEDDIDFFIDNAETTEVIVFGLLMYFQTIIVAPIFEELLFRGIILNGLLNKYKNNSKKAIIYSAIIFGMVHLNIPQGINAFIAGIILGFIYYYTKSMKLSIFAHFVNNLITFVPVPENIIFKFIYIVIGVYAIIKSIRYIRKIKSIHITETNERREITLLYFIFNIKRILR